MLSWLGKALNIKLYLHWLFIYIVVNILEFIIMKLIFSWMFPVKKEKEANSNDL